MTLSEAIKEVLENPDLKRHYIYTARPFTPDSPAFIELRANLGWDNPAYNGALPMGVVNMAYVKDLRLHYARFEKVTDDTQGAIERLVEFYQNNRRY